MGHYFLKNTDELNRWWFIITWSWFTNFIKLWPDIIFFSKKNNCLLTSLTALVNWMSWRGFTQNTTGEVPNPRHAGRQPTQPELGDLRQSLVVTKNASACKTTSYAKFSENMWGWTSWVPVESPNKSLLVDETRSSPASGNRPWATTALGSWA